MSDMWFLTREKWPSGKDTERGIVVAFQSSGQWFIDVTHSADSGKPMADWGMMNFGSPPAYWIHLDTFLKMNCLPVVLKQAEVGE